MWLSLIVFHVEVVMSCCCCMHTARIQNLIDDDDKGKAYMGHRAKDSISWEAGDFHMGDEETRPCAYR